MVNNMSKKSFSTITHIILFSLLAGILVTFQNYEFGAGNHIEQLPLIFRSANPDYLPNDFFVNSASGFGPRFYYTALIGFIGRVISIEDVFLLFTLLSNILVVLITGFTARNLFGEWAGLLVIPIISAGGIIQLGEASALTQSNLLPQLLVMPLCLAAIWAALRQNWLLCAGLAVVGSFIHPLAALETGFIAILSTFLIQPGKNRRTIFCAGAAAIILVITALGWFLQESGGSIDQSEFIRILAFFRHPHHYLPSTFPIRAYVDTVFLLIAVAIAAYWLWHRSYTSAHTLGTMGFMIVVVLVLCVGGYIFVEVIPSRLWVTAQTFRLLFIVNWLGKILIAAGISYWLTASKENFDAYPLFFGAAAPILVGVIFLGKLLKNWIVQWLNFPPRIFTGLLLVLVLIYCMVQPVSIAYIALALLICILFRAEYRGIPSALIVSVFYIGLVMLLSLTLFFPTNELDALTERLFKRPIIALSDLTGPEVEITKYAKELTPPDSIFLTPPDWGSFRILADRAIVVDFKAFPFQEEAMVEWRDRLFDVYGESTKNGTPARDEMDNHYRNITDEKLSKLQSKYNISYAVLYAETETQFREIFATDQFKIVSITNSS
jgi:hypothetical protein